MVAVSAGVKKRAPHAVLSDEGHCFHSMVGEEIQIYALRLPPTWQVCRVDTCFCTSSRHCASKTCVGSLREQSPSFVLRSALNILPHQGISGHDWSEAVSQGVGARPSPWHPRVQGQAVGWVKEWRFGLLLEDVWQREAVRPAGNSILRRHFPTARRPHCHVILTGPADIAQRTRFWRLYLGGCYAREQQKAQDRF